MNTTKLAFHIILLTVMISSVQAESLSILGGSTPDIVLGRQYVSSADCVNDTCTFKGQKLIEAGTPLWSSGSHILLLHPILNLKEMAWDIDHTPKVEVSIDGKRFNLKDGETKDLTPYLTVRINMQAMTEKYIDYGQSAFRNEPPFNNVYKDRLFGIKYEINIFLNPDSTSTILFADSINKQFKRDTELKFQLSSSNGLDWAIIGSDSSNSFFTGTTYSIKHESNLTSPRIVSVPINTNELGERIITVFPAIQSSIFNQEGINTQDSVYTQSSNGIQAKINVIPEVIGVKEIPINAYPISRIQQLKKTSIGEQGVIDSKNEVAFSGILLLIITGSLAYAILRRK